jgi:hypothetical protein
MGGLEEMIAGARALAELPERTAQIAAEKLDQAVKASASAGQSPDGKAWAPTKKGGRAMANAASHITTRAIGPVIRQTLSGVDVFHHYGKGASEERRPVIPDAGGPLPKLVADVLDEASAQAFDELVR